MKYTDRSFISRIIYTTTIVVLAVGLHYYLKTKPHNAPEFRITYEDIHHNEPDLGRVSGTTYYNDTYGVSIEIPKGWVSYPQSDGVLGVSQVVHDGKATMKLSMNRMSLSNVSSKRRRGGFESIKQLDTLKEVVENHAKIVPIEQKEQTKRKILSSNEITINGEDAFVVELEDDWVDSSGIAHTTRELYVLLAKGNVRYYFGASAPAREYENYRQTFVDTAKTITIQRTWVDLLVR